jgi:hypothetical protein
MQRVRHVSGSVKRILLLILIVGLAGLAAPERTLAEGQGIVKKSEGTKAGKPRKMSEAEKKRLRNSLTSDLKKMNARIGNDLVQIRLNKDTHAIQEERIDIEHEKQIKADKERQALEKSRNKIVRKLQRESKSLSRAEKDEMVRQANWAQKEIKAKKAEIEKSKNRVKQLRRNQSQLTIKRSRIERRVFDEQKKVKKVEADLKKLK